MLLPVILCAIFFQLQYDLPQQQNAKKEPYEVPAPSAEMPYSNRQSIQGVPLHEGKLYVYYKVGHGTTYFEAQADKRRISSLSDLKGRVRIHNKNEALAFVRCFTTPQTYKAADLLPDWRVLEVFREQDAPKRVYGIAKKDEAARIGFQVPSVQWSGNHWTIRRFLIVAVSINNEQNFGKVYLSEETVDAEGHYKHNVKKWFGVSAPEIRVPGGMD